MAAVGELVRSTSGQRTVWPSPRRPRQSYCGCGNRGGQHRSGLARWCRRYSPICTVGTSCPGAGE